MYVESLVQTHVGSMVASSFSVSPYEACLVDSVGHYHTLSIRKFHFSKKDMTVPYSGLSDFGIATISRPLRSEEWNVIGKVFSR